MSLNDFGSILKAGAVSMLLPFACLLCVPEIKAKASASKGSFASPSWIPLKRSSLTSCWGIKFQYLNIDSLLPCFSVNPALIRKKELDTMSFKSVLHHPYLEYEDVQLIFNAKRKFGKINYSILESQKVLPPFKLKKIKPYFK